MAFVYTDEQNYIDIANSIRAKNNSTQTYLPEEMSKAIDDIEVGIDTSGATATDSDIAAGKTAYVNGEKITGALVEINTSTYQLNKAYAEEYSDELCVVKSIISNDVILRDGLEVRIPIYKTSFGTATTSDVASGKTFTSEDGILIEGTINYGAYYDDTCTIKSPDIFEYRPDGVSCISTDFSGFDNYSTYIVVYNDNIVGLAFKSGDSVYLVGKCKQSGSAQSYDLYFYGINNLNG